MRPIAPRHARLVYFQAAPAQRGKRRARLLDFRRRARPLERHGPAAHAHQRQHQFAQHVQRSHRPRRRRVKRSAESAAPGVLCAQAHGLGVQIKPRDCVLQEPYPLGKRIHEHKARIRQENGERHAGEPRAATHVHARFRPAQMRKRGEGIDVVAVDGLGGVVRHAGEVHARVGLRQQGVEGAELVKLFRRRGNARRLQSGLQKFAHVRPPSVSRAPRLFRLPARGGAFPARW